MEGYFTKSSAGGSITKLCLAFVTPWAVALQAPLCMELPQLE